MSLNTKTNHLKSVLALSAASFGFVVVMALGILQNEHVQVSVLGKTLDPISAVIMSPLGLPELSAKVGEWTYCDYEFPENPEYSVELISASTSKSVTAGEEFEMNFEFKNTGNVRLFSAKSTCLDVPHFQLGTQKPMDRDSVFGNALNGVDGWNGANRLVMSDRFADPGETFSVNVTSVAPEGHENDLYREYFQPVVEGVAWLSDVISIDVEVGQPTDAMRGDMSFVKTVSINAQSLAGQERNLEANLGEQRMFAKFGDLVVWEMPISSGAHDTPTPRGHYNIFQKQELRIGGKSPHYRMPYWQFWDARGFGIHGLPYLGSRDSSAFWKEAENHMGRPVSHGCIRTRDADAEALYKFTIIGTPVWVR